MSARILVVIPLCFGMLGAASGEISSACAAAATPSRFDYLVLASLADSQSPVWMASYRPGRSQSLPGVPELPHAHDRSGAHDPLEVAVQLE
jgi:hypothetical protein